MHPLKSKRTLLKDVTGICFLFVAVIALGLVINKFRNSPLPSGYASPKERLNNVVTDMGVVSSNVNFKTPGGDVTLEDMKEISSNASATILDARPEVFYKVGHISV